MQTPGRSISHLPLELLTEIFRLATANPARDLDSLVSWTPFEGSYATSTREKCKAALCTKHALALVCRLFRTLSIELLYEDIWIRHGSAGLLEALEASKDSKAISPGLGFGKFVKRVSLSAVGFDGSGRPCGSILENTRRILSCCPNLRAIARPPQEFVEDQDEFVDSVPPIDDLSFPFLHRVDWYNTPNDSVFATAPTPSFIWFSQPLRVLILGPDNFPTPSGEHTAETIVELPNLHTLGFQSLNTFGEGPRTYSVKLPSLRRLIIKRPEAIYNLFDGCLTPFCSQITALELSADFRFLRQDFVATLLGYCPNTEDLYIPVFTTRAPYQNEVPRVVLEFAAVKRVYMHAGLPHGYEYEEQAWWAMLDGHFEGLCGQNSRFVALERIILSGREWMESVKDRRFATALRLVRTKDLELTCDNTEVQSSLAFALKETGLSYDTR